MKTVGFLKSDKENENRICLLPEDINVIQNKKYIYVEEGYGKNLNIEDNEYIKAGVNVVDKQEIFDKNIIVEPKIGDAQYLKKLKNKTIFGWIHAVQNKAITDILIKNKLTVYAWEEMFEEGRHIFWRNNEIAGEAAVMHALLIHGIMPYNLKVAIIGNGNVSRGAYRVLTQLGCNITVYNRKMEKLLSKEIAKYDIIVNAVLWDVNRKDHIIYKEDLMKMKKGSLIIDVSCDHNGAIETSKPTTIEKPTYWIDGVEHYVVDHTPSLVYRTVSKELSGEVCKFIDYFITDSKNDVLNSALIVKNGVILDNNINEYQKRK